MSAMGALGSSPRDRVASAVLSGALSGALGWALITGLGVSLPRAAEEAFPVFDVAPPPPSREEVVPPPRRSRRPEGRAAPPNLRSKATRVVAPEPIIVTPVPPPPIAVAPVANTGAQGTQGAADRPGPGQGAGGIGDGFGGGGDGDGDGGGWGPETPPRRVRGRLSSSMIPEHLRDRPGFARYTVGLRYTVGADGRVTDCRVARSSGEPALDANTCRGVEERFRYRPARDETGRPVRSTVVIDWDWDVEGPDPDDTPRR